MRQILSGSSGLTSRERIIVAGKCASYDFDPKEKGIYTIVLRLSRDLVVEVGSLGKVSFRAGWYAYTGSARGAGGLKRVLRHIAVMEGKNRTRRWHIDHLLPLVELEEVVATITGEDLECSIARKLGDRLPSVEGFGSTDCSCPSHLHFSERKEEILFAARDAHPRGRGDGKKKRSYEEEPAEDGGCEDQKAA